jgi:hypothetical protein
MSAEQRTAVLSSEAEAILSLRECCSIRTGDFNWAAIHNCDGDHVVSVSLSIGGQDLAAILRHGEQEYSRGYERGRSDMQAAIRNLLNAAPLEPTS